MVPSVYVREVESMSDEFQKYEYLNQDLHTESISCYLTLVGLIKQWLTPIYRVITN